MFKNLDEMAREADFCLRQREAAFTHAQIKDNVIIGAQRTEIE